MKYLVTGLGNPDPEYELTRHNIGFLVLDQLADRQNAQFSRQRRAFTSSFKYKGRQINLIKPTTYMNLSGKAVNFWLKQLKLQQSQLLVVTDDLALPFGKLRMRAKGSDAGHNGLRNIDQILCNNNYARLRFGIGNRFVKDQQVDYVLSKFSEEEFHQLPEYIDKACDMILSLTSIGIERTMNLYN